MSENDPPNTARAKDAPKWVAIFVGVLVVLGILFYLGNNWYGGPSPGVDDPAGNRLTDPPDTQ